jgi:hypothetical protein
VEQRAGQREWGGDRRIAQSERRDPSRANRVEQRNRTYTDPNRNGSYADRDRRDGNRWNDDNNARRDGNRWNNDNDRRDSNRWSNNSNRRGNERWNDNNRRGNESWRSNARNDSRRWDRNWRNDNRYDWRRYRTSNRVVFHVGTYYAPYRDYSYRRFGIGSLLDSLFFGSRYWIADPWQYRLPEVYGPYRWVRYYDDVLLVDIYSGEVVDVIYDFFW